MKKGYIVFFVILFSLLLALTGRENTSSDGPIVFPGTKWNMTPQQVTDALSLAEEDYTVTNDNSYEYVFSANGLDVFGHNAKVTFVFRSFTGDQYGLNQVFVCYTDAVATDILEKKLTKNYGAPESASDGFGKSDSLRWRDPSDFTPYIEAAIDSIPEDYPIQSENLIAAAQHYYVSEVFLIEKSEMSTELRSQVKDFPNNAALIFYAPVTPFLQYAEHGYPLPE